MNGNFSYNQSYLYNSIGLARRRLRTRGVVGVLVHLIQPV
jgi:hypothetical protein